MKFIIILLLVTFSLPADCQVFLTNSLIAYFPFNGNAQDASGRNNSTTVSGATLTEDRFGNANSAYTFDGVNDLISANVTNIVSGAAGRTLSAWVKLSTVQARTYVAAAWGQDGVNNSVFGIMAQGNPTPNWFAQHYGGGQDVSSGIAADAAWHQITCTYTNGISKIFIDGSLKGSAAKSLNTYPGVLSIGGGVEVVAGNGFFMGSIDEVRIYNRALTDGEVGGLFIYDAPPRISLLKAVRPALTNLHVGTNYQLQITSDLINWTNHNASFTATNTSITYPQYFDVDVWNQLYFRVESVP